MTALFILELIGTVAFAVSGASVAIERRMDIFGIAILGATTAVGGGIIRDLLLGITPPTAFREPVYALLAIAVSLIVFLPVIRDFFTKHTFLLLLMDSVGLGVFTVVGVGTAVAFDNLFLSVFVGLLSGVGGGVLRDVFAGTTPYVFVRHFYATASLIGALVAALLFPVNEHLAMIVGAALVVVIRLLAAKYRWKLPRP